MNPVFRHHDLRLVTPEFDSSLTSLILKLDYLRRKRLSGSTPPGIFFQLNDIFHTLESIGSARIEGNNTTIAEYIEARPGPSDGPPPNKDIQEILNMERAMAFIDDNVNDVMLGRAFVRELHKKVVEGLPPPPHGEGDHAPGSYRVKPVSISGSAHRPPDPLHIEGYMDELFGFIGHEDALQHDLLKVAIAHHRFLWIHPFTNGNGRTVRLFTYAMLVKQGFRVDVGRILNPSAVFCLDRENYYRYLALADTGERGHILSWCEYVLSGLRDEIEKTDRLLDYKYLKNEILLPAIRYSKGRKLVSDVEAKVLERAVEKKEVRASDLKGVFAGKTATEVSRNIRRLRDNKMLKPVGEGKRKYIIRLDNTSLMRGIIKLLGDKGFISIED